MHEILHFPVKVIQSKVLFGTILLGIREHSGDYDLAKGKSPKFVTEKGEKYSFKVKKNGKYTIWISDDKGNIYTKVVTVKGLKK